MIREDRELLAELARVNSEVTPLAMRIMDGSATADEQRDLAERMIGLGRRLHERPGRTGTIVEGQVVDNPSAAPSSCPALHREP